MLRSVILFAHVMSAMTIVAAFGVEGLILRQLRETAGVGQARDVLRNFRFVQKTLGVGVGLTLVTGIYLASVYWRWQGAWMATAFVTVIAIAIVGATMTGRTMAAFLGQSEPSTGLWLEQKKTVLGASFVIRLMMLIGIVFLMA